MGSQGKVVLVRKKSNQKLYAMKIVSKTDMNKSQINLFTLVERKILGEVDHPFLVKLVYSI